MTSVGLKNSMALFARRLAYIALTYLISSVSFASDTATVDFSAVITDGSCDISLSDTRLSFGTHRYVDVSGMTSGTTIKMLPLTANVTCSSASSPILSVAGTTSSSPAIFRDADSVSSGVGFMIRRDIGGITTGSFYDEVAAMKVNEPVILNPVGDGQASVEPLLLGLVRDSDGLSPGLIKASVTFTVLYQ